MDINFLEISDIGDWLNNNQGILSVIIFTLTLLIAWGAGIFKWVGSQVSKRERASKIICVWSLFPDKEDKDFFIFKFAPRFQNKTDETIRDFLDKFLIFRFWFDSE